MVDELARFGGGFEQQFATATAAITTTAAAATEGDNGKAGKTPTRIREIFPETWIWTQQLSTRFSIKATCC